MANWNYPNGRFPLSNFIHRGGNIYLTPSLNARWNEAVRLAQEKYGVRLYITGDVDGLGGWNGYRPYSAQVRYKNHYGRFAAAPGFSSHGGVYGGKLVFAADVANWQRLGNTTAQAWSRFVAIMRLVGLTTNFVTPEERWHIGDFNNPDVAPTFGKPVINGNTNRPTSEEEDEMKGAHYKRKSDGVTVYLLFNEVSGFWVEHTGVKGDYNNEIARFWNTQSWASITEAHANVIKTALNKTRTRSA